MSMNDATKYTLCWNWYSNYSTIVREEFVSRAACWARVQELMKLEAAPWDGAPVRRLCYIQVYQDRPQGGSKVADFRQYERGCKFDKWNGWGVSNYETTGEHFG